MSTRSYRGLRAQALRRLAAATVFAAAAPTALASAWLECSGNKIKWNDRRADMFISTTSMPAGSAWDVDLQNAMFHWNQVGGANFNFFVGRDTDGSHNDDNGTTEIYFDGAEASGSTLAVTHKRYHCYWFFGHHQGIDEADIAFNTNAGWNTGAFNYANLNSPFHFETVALHELGHVLGLSHEDDVMATLNTFYADGGPQGSAKQVLPLPDDHGGVRALYPDGSSQSDVTSAAMKRTGAGTSGLINSPASAARGSSVTIEFTFGNNGTAAASFNIGFFLSTNDIISTGDRLLGTNFGASAGPGALGTFSRTLTIPADVAPGTYFLGFLIDSGGTVVEGNESNNNQPMPRSITIF